MLPMELFVEYYALILVCAKLEFLKNQKLFTKKQPQIPIIITRLIFVKT